MTFSWLFYAETDYAAGWRPIGRLAQTSMRTQKGFISHGHDVDTDVTPAMAGLAFQRAGKTRGGL